MKKIFGFSLILIVIAALFLFQPAPIPKTTSSAPPTPQPEVQYKSYTLEQSLVHTLTLPASSGFTVTAAISSQLETLESFAQKHKAIAVLNGGFFDPENGKSTSTIIVQGQLVANPRNNERLINNPNLAPYLAKILNRSEFRRYLCGKATVYDIALRAASIPAECQLVDALGGGPSLLPLTLVEEGFLDLVNGETMRDSLGSSQGNSRSAIGIKSDRTVIFVMVAQKPNIASGMSLQKLADFMKTLGVEKAMNLDGGSSSALYYNGKTIHGKVDETGNPLKRPVKSVLMIQSEKQ